MCGVVVARGTTWKVLDDLCDLFVEPRELVSVVKEKGKKGEAGVSRLLNEEKRKNQKTKLCHPSSFVSRYGDR